MRALLLLGEQRARQACCSHSAGIVASSCAKALLGARRSARRTRGRSGRSGARPSPGRRAPGSRSPRPTACATRASSASSSVRNSVSETGTPARAQLEEELHQHGRAPVSARGGAGTPAARTGARPARSSAARRAATGSVFFGSPPRSASGGMSSATSSLIQSSSSEVEGFFFSPGVARSSKNALSASASSSCFRSREVHVDDARASSPRPGSGCSGRSSGAGRRPAAPSRCCW